VRRNYNNSCAVIVLNRQGAGVCLNAVGSSAVPVYLGDGKFLAYSGTSIPGTYYCEGNRWGDDCADNFMWRKMQAQRRDGTFRWFSPKCVVQGNCAAGELFLPDRAQYPNIFP
jgi:hypothetical protein